VPANPGACFCKSCGQPIGEEPAATRPNMTFWLLREEPSPGDAYDALSPAEKEKKFHELFPDMTEDAVKPEKIKNEKLNPGVAGGIE